MTTLRATGKYFIENGKVEELSARTPEPAGDTWYEVLRLIKGRLLFLPEHLDRLRSSMSGSGIDHPGDQNLRQDLGLLIRSNRIESGNIRLCISGDRLDSRVRCYFIEHHYPDPGMYAHGVEVATFQHSRIQPGIKKWDQSFRRDVWSYIRQKGVYEALLYNELGVISEGSRSNIFFIDAQDQLLTTPGRDVLPGITRRYVVELARKKGFRIREKNLRLDELELMRAAFISGTSPGVLPIRMIDDVAFDPGHPLLKVLMESFELLMQEHLSAP